MQDELRREWAAICAMAAIFLVFLTFSPPRLCAKEPYTEASIELTEKSRLRLMRFSDPDLTIFRDAVAILRDTQPSAAVLGREEGFPGSISFAGKAMHGLIFMPNYAGYEYATIRETYETYNGLSVEKFRLQADLSLGESANFTTEAQYRPHGPRPEQVFIRFAMSIRYPEASKNQFLPAEMPEESGSSSGDAASRVRVPKLRMTEIDSDLHAILDVKGQIESVIVSPDMVMLDTLMAD